MAISETYGELILEQILRDLLLHGESPRLSTITSDFNTFTATNDISKPLFKSTTSKVTWGENSSATKNNLTNNTILQDLSVLYKHIFKISEQSLLNFERWKAESQLLEGRLDILTDRINNLLLLSSDTAGFFNFIQDNFVDTSKVDLTNSNAYVNTSKDIVTIGTSSPGATRVNLSSLSNKDVEFTVLSRNNLIATLEAEGSQPVFAISDGSSYWQERVWVSKPGPVSAELKIHFPEATTLSKIELDLHMSNQSAAVQVIVQYSIDNYTWIQLPTDSFTQSVLRAATFTFTPIQVQYVKFIMTKPGYDSISNGLYAYEFGLDMLAFFNEGFGSNIDSTLISQALSVTGTDGLPEDFGKVVLEVCEDIPTGTSINYYIGVTNDSSAVPNDINFVGIDPITRTTTTLPSILDFGDISLITISDIYPSYDPSATDSSLINPSASFDYLKSTAGGITDTRAGLSSAQRYSFSNSNERILSLSLGPDIQIAQNSIELWRNVHTTGSTTLVRGTSNGWRFEEPYYKTTVQVNNANGYSIDWGGKTAVVDGGVQSGKVNLSTGKHTIWIHKDNWRYVDPTTIVDLTTLKSLDNLYPYNHKYVVEGFNYPTTWPIGTEKIYQGFDIVAEYLTQEVSIFDLESNISPGDYGRFAIDLDTGDPNRELDGSSAADADKVPIRVFVVKVDETRSDFMNELFMLRFKSTNTLYKYLRFKAVLLTTDSTRTPLLDSYRIKVST